MMAERKGTVMVMIAESGREGARLRAAVDRLHEAQLAALAALPAPEAFQPGGRDAFGAERRLLEHAGEMGSLLARLGRADAEADAALAVDVRRRLVTLAVGCANTLAELVGLAFEVEGVGGQAGERGAVPAGRPAAPTPAMRDGGGSKGSPGSNGSAGSKGSPGSNGASAPARVTTSLRAVTDTNRLLVDQLRRLMQNVQRQESWRSARPGELWLGLLLQVAALFPLAAAQEAGALSEEEAKELSRLTADAANYVAFIRCFPRVPTA
jgi:hypothetical protein